MIENKHGEPMMPRPDKSATPDYNSTRSTLKMPEYGRLVQDMVDYALTIENKQERQRYAEAIVEVMTGLNPKMKDVPDFLHKMWDHLAYIADYKLDIKYPFEITRHDGERIPPAKLSYPQGRIRFRHYGKLVEKAMKNLAEMEEGPKRDELTRMVANRMKRNLADWKGDGIEDSKVASDIAYYTEGKVEPDFSKPNSQLMQIGENRFRTRKNKNMF